MSSFYDLASLVMIPSGKKAGKVYSQKPLTTDGQLDFTRASTATRIGSDGKIEKTRTNELLQSNTFNTTWTTSNVSLTSGQSGYDGTNDAWLITKSSGFANVAQSVSASGVNTYSVYAKANTLNWLRIVGGSTSAFFDLNNGVVGSTDAGNIAKMTSIGSGWYRCEVAMNASTTIMRIYPADGDNDVSGSSGSIYIQDAQLEQGLVATNYIDTTTAAVSVGSVDNMPRLNYTAGSTSSCPSLLLEPQSTNIILNSEYFDSGYIYSNITQSINTSISSPSNENAVYEFNDGTATGLHNAYVTSAQATSADSIFSLFAKQGTSKYIRLGSLSNGAERAVFDLNAGTVHAAPTAPAIDIYGIENYGNGWYRCYIKLESGERAFIQAVDTDGSTFNYTGSNQTFYVWGAQVETGSYASSYIPTFGATVTRVAENALSIANSLGGLSVGTFFIEMSRDAIDPSITGSAISLRDNSGGEEIRLHFDAPTSQVRWRDANNSFALIGGVLSVTAGTTFKILVKTDGTTAKAFGNGAQLGSNYSVVSAFDFQRIYNSLGGYKIKKELFFPTALTDAQCIELTTLDL